MTSEAQVVTDAVVETQVVPAGDGLPAVEELPAVAHRRRWRRLLVALLLVLLPVAAVGGVAGGLYAWDASYEGRILPGVHVGTVDVSGLDRAAAGAAIAAAYPYGDGHVILRSPDGDVVVPYADLGRRPDIDALVDEAMAAGRGGTLLERTVGQVRQALDGATIAPRLLVDRASIAPAVSRAVAGWDRAPVDATIAMGPDAPVTTPARAGQAVDPAPAAAAVAAAIASVDAPAEVVIEVVPVAVAPVVDDAAVAAAAARADRLVGDVVVTFKDKHWTIRAATVRGWIRFKARPGGSVTPIVDTSLIGGALAKPTKAVAKAPVNALFLKGRGGHPIGVVASKNGRRLDVVGTVTRIAAELQARAVGAEAARVAVAVASVAPKLTTEEARKTAPVMTRLGTWTTYFPISDHNFFGANIWRPAQIIDGTVLSPGEKFDWWDAIWPVTPARGFGPGGVIRGDHTDPTGALGGGMCSSSTTLFNAAMRAGLAMGARSNHKYYIPRYPLGLDATVSIMGGGRQTMSFWNDTDHAIVIRAFRIRHGSAGYVRYEIWGIPDGRRVSISRPSVRNLRKATTSTVYVDTLRHGVRNQVEYPSNQMDVSVTRIVRNAAGRVIHSDTWQSHYVLWNGLIEIGR